MQRLIWKQFVLKYLTHPSLPIRVNKYKCKYVLHPASPRVSKGAPGKGGKKSRSIEKVEEKNDAYVSDVDIPPSGMVALVANALSMKQESPSDSANSDEGKYELTYLPLIFSVSLLHIEVGH